MDRANHAIVKHIAQLTLESILKSENQVCQDIQGITDQCHKFLDAKVLSNYKDNWQGVERRICGIRDGAITLRKELQ